MEDQRVAAEAIQDGTAAERFAEQLRTLRTAVGNPSFRKMAGRSGRISHTTLHEAAAGTRFPSWETTREFVRACQADEVEWRRRWDDAQPAASTPVDDVEPDPGDVPGKPEFVEMPRSRRRRWPVVAAAAGAVVAAATAGIIHSVTK